MLRPALALRAGRVDRACLSVPSRIEASDRGYAAALAIARRRVEIVPSAQVQNCAYSYFFSRRTRDENDSPCDAEYVPRACLWRAV